jgi:hypothetical protein
MGVASLKILLASGALPPDSLAQGFTPAPHWGIAPDSHIGLCNHTGHNPYLEFVTRRYLVSLRG